MRGPARWVEGPWRSERNQAAPSRAHGEVCAGGRVVDYG